MSYLEDRRRMKTFGKKAEDKKQYGIQPKSKKKIAEEAAAKEAGTDQAMDKFYEAMRKKMVGVCQCGCGLRSQKSDDNFFRHCICHIFPKKIFKSIETHTLNWVERTFWGGHHTNLDERGMDKWPAMADWDDIKEKFHVLSELLTDAERATKFYNNLSKLVYAN